MIWLLIGAGSWKSILQRDDHPLTSLIPLIPLTPLTRFETPQAFGFSLEVVHAI